MGMLSEKMSLNKRILVDHTGESITNRNNSSGIGQIAKFFFSACLLGLKNLFDRKEDENFFEGVP